MAKAARFDFFLASNKWKSVFTVAHRLIRLVVTFHDFAKNFTQFNRVLSVLSIQRQNELVLKGIDNANNEMVLANKQLIHDQISMANNKMAKTK